MVYVCLHEKHRDGRLNDGFVVVRFSVCYPRSFKDGTCFCRFKKGQVNYQAGLADILLLGFL